MFKLFSNLFAGFSSPPETASAGQNPFSSAGEPAAALQGDLGVVTIENLMQLVSHAGLSGELHLLAPDNDACFIIRHGALVFGHVKSNFPRTGERLVNAGYITTEDLQECLRLYQEQGSASRIGELLVNREFISTSHLEEIIREQVKDGFFKVLSWKSGSFSFFPNESPPGEDILLDERIDHLVLEGIMAVDHGSSSF